MSVLDQANEFLASGGVPSAKFENHGDTCSGPVVHAERQQQREIDTGKPKFWDDGTPREQIVIHLDTAQRDPGIPDDDGRRAVYVRGNMLKALRVAVKRSGAKLELGGVLTVTYTGDGEQTTRGFNRPKLYDVTYTPPSAAAVNDLLGDTAEAPAPAPAAPAAKLPPGMTAQQWAELPQAAKESLAKVYDLAPY